jgi:Domain of unknown function (DUF4907)
MVAKYSLIFIQFLLLSACNSTVQKTKENSGAAESSTTINNVVIDSYSFKTFTVGNYWGYDICKDNKLLIHQPNIPAIEGDRGFSSEQKAISVANLMIQKLQNGIMPPTLSIEELDSLKVTE